MFGSLLGLILLAVGFSASIKGCYFTPLQQVGRVSLLFANHARRGFKCRLMPGKHGMDSKGKLFSKVVSSTEKDASIESIILFRKDCYFIV
jgi:hypothetical protein